jgi:hypothetical protein
MALASASLAVPGRLVVVRAVMALAEAGEARLHDRSHAGPVSLGRGATALDRLAANAPRCRVLRAGRRARLEAHSLAAPHRMGAGLGTGKADAMTKIVCDLCGNSAASNPAQASNIPVRRLLPTSGDVCLSASLKVVTRAGNSIDLCSNCLLRVLPYVQDKLEKLSD